MNEASSWRQQVTGDGEKCETVAASRSGKKWIIANKSEPMRAAGIIIYSNIIIMEFLLFIRWAHICDGIEFLCTTSCQC